MENCGIKYQIINNPDGSVVVSGNFKIKEKEIYNIHSKRQSAIVMVITTPTSFYSFNPFKETIIFSDDVQKDDGYITGNFNINLSEIILDMKDIRYNILLTIGQYMSNIEKIIKNK
ncbi:MAG: hypothetical protein QM503_12210 [Bacteroidota bacterium]